MLEKKDKALTVGNNEMELVDFRISKIENGEIYEGVYGVNVSKVREIIRIPEVTELPGVPSYIEGIFDLRGVVIPVVNLAKWMNLETPESVVKTSRVIIAEFNNVLIGFVVHDARRIRRISWADIEPASFNVSGDSSDANKITGMTRIENEQVLLILDLESVVQDLGLYTPSTDMTDNDTKKFAGTALLLDDSSTARKIISDGLKHMGFRVVTATDGEDGLSKLNDLHSSYGDNLQKELRIIVSDIEMPLMDGFTFAANVKADGRYKDIPIVFSSSISDHFSENRGREAGGEAYLVKFDASTFYKEVTRVLESHEEKGA
ncbi:MAG: response regulator [Helicobacteraceae bacterium]|nr:response regulator [Helicobacteraceae bacterium]